MKKTTKKTLISIGLYLLIAITFSYFLVINRSHHIGIGEYAPFHGDIKILQGGSISFRSINNKPLLVNFWASWCPSCRQELLLINKLFNKYKEDINFMGIIVDSEVDDIKKIIKYDQIAYPMGLIDKKSLEDWQVFSLPTTYLIDKYGQIKWAMVGMIKEDSLREAIDKVF